MHYILTEEEMEDYRKRARALDEFPSRENLQKFCTTVADNMPVKSGWKKGQIWGCILTREDEWYCDDCPAEKVCPYPNKAWSK